MAEVLTAPKNEGSPTLFQKNRIMEKLSRAHISVPIILLNLYSGFAFYWGLTKTDVGLAPMVLLFFAGMFVWTFTEYMIHRHIWHMETPTEPRKKFQYTMHGVHHEYPKDKSRLAMPPALSLLLATAFLLVYYLVLGKFGFAFFSGFVTAYTLYLIVHFVVHAYQPPKNFLKWLWINHGIHHYKNDDIAFGVSSPLWDIIFRTMPARKK